VVRIAAVVGVLAVLAALNVAQLWQVNDEGSTSSMAPTLPPCGGQVLSEGFTYHFRDPRRGEIVLFHARGSVGGVRIPDAIYPDADSRELQVNKRVIGVPGDTVVGRGGRVYVNGRRADDIPTSAFDRVRLGRDDYFVLGDNRSASRDSRWFGTVPRAAIYARVILNLWPLRRFGVPRYDKAHTPPGKLCGAAVRGHVTRRAGAVGGRRATSG
jgi:signal peptidase I